MSHQTKIKRRARILSFGPEDAAYGREEWEWAINQRGVFEGFQWIHPEQGFHGLFHFDEPGRHIPEAYFFSVELELGEPVE